LGGTRDVWPIGQNPRVTGASTSRRPIGGSTRITESRVELAGVRSRELRVSGEGPPLIFFHGFSDSADTWRPLLERCLAAGRAAVAYDQPGFGLADAMRIADPVLPQLDAFADAVVEHERVASGGPVIIAGNSLGGTTALRAAGRHGPSTIKAIVPIGPAGLTHARWLQIIEAERALWLLLRSPVKPPEFVTREIVGRAYRLLGFSRPSGAPPELVASFTRHLADLDRVKEILASGRRLYPEINGSCYRFKLIECPVLLIWGDVDRFVPISGAQQLIESVPHTEFVVIPQCGHLPQVECPDRVAELVLAL
jgi:pimeloyl-ACP methyl ester carboxylesterase